MKPKQGWAAKLLRRWFGVKCFFEYRLDGDWLKDACRALAAEEPKP